MTTSIIYSVSSLPEWLDVADRLHTELGWRPVYWITQKAKNHERVIGRFPEAVAHSSEDINRCISAPGFEDCFRYPLGEDLLKSMFFHEGVAMQLMDRMDMEGGFPCLERRRTYHRLLMYWMNVVDRLSPHVVVFNTSPHSIAEYVLYAVARYRGLRTPIFVSTAVNGLLFVNDSVEGGSAELRTAYRHCLLTDDSWVLSRGASEYLAGARSRDAGAVPWYVAVQQGQQQIQHRRYQKLVRASRQETTQPALLGRLSRTLQNIAGMLLPGYKPPRRPEKVRPAKDRWRARRDDRRPMNRVYKRAGIPLEASHLRRNEYRAYLDRTYKVKLGYKALYESLCADVPINVPYVYVPMHYQPERTTCPDGGIYNDQSLMVNLLSHALPEGWWLYVKEHPTQFSYAGNGEQSRNEYFYQDLHSLPNMRFIRLETPTLELTDNARAVATVTGMAGWEAVCRGKPALVFGNAWYRLCRGVYPIRTADDCRDALLAIKNGVTVKSRDVEAFVAALEHISASGYVNPSNAPGVKVSYTDHVQRLTWLLKRFADRISATHTPDVSEIYSVNQQA
ncbi:MAG: hypothetical protein ACREXS_19695 [Gammaproteobacteria bacterium]